MRRHLRTMVRTRVARRHSESFELAVFLRNGSDTYGRSSYRFVDGPSRTWSSSAQSHLERSDQHPTGLVKQAYSAWVLTPANAKPRKWHLTAYFTYSDLPYIPTLDRDPMLSTLTVPQGVYRSGKSRSRNADAAPGGSPTSPRPSSASSSTHARPSDSLVLPLPGPADSRGAARPVLPRAAEDERMIQMLNSRPL